MKPKIKNNIFPVIRQALVIACCIPFMAAGCSRSNDKDTSPPEENNKDTTAYYTLRVLAFNIQRGKVTDGSTDLDLYAKIIREVDPDIVALSEIDRNIARSGNVDQTTVLAEKTGMKGYFGKFRDYKGGDWGDAILSRLPVLDFKVVAADSRLDPKHERSYIFAKIKLGENQSFYFNCSHLTPYVEEQKTIQANELLQYYDSALHKAPLLICGDLNSFPNSDAMKALFTQFKPSDPYFKPTFNARKHLTRKIDYILYPKNVNWELIKFKRIIRDDASDHCAILSVFKIKKIN